MCLGFHIQQHAVSKGGTIAFCFNLNLSGAQGGGYFGPAAQNRGCGIDAGDGCDGRIHLQGQIAFRQHPFLCAGDSYGQQDRSLRPDTGIRQCEVNRILRRCSQDGDDAVVQTGRFDLAVVELHVFQGHGCGFAHQSCFADFELQAHENARSCQIVAAFQPHRQFSRRNRGDTLRPSLRHRRGRGHTGRRYISSVVRYIKTDAAKPHAVDRGDTDGQ